MNQATVRVLTQYEENYGLADGGADCWKPKGGVEFTFEIEADVMLYEKEKVLDCVKAVLNEKSNRFCRYSYLGHELVFDKPISIQQEMDKALSELMTTG